jgi:DNA gyrase subunit A
VDEARAGLMEKFKLTQIQAQAILEMQIQRLTHLERDKIVQEYKEVKAFIVKLRKILGSPELVLDIIVEELKEIKEKYVDERRTEIRDEVIGMVSIGEAEKYVFTASEKGYDKRTEVASYRKTHRGGKGLINLKITPKIGRPWRCWVSQRTTC